MAHRTASLVYGTSSGWIVDDGGLCAYERLGGDVFGVDGLLIGAAHFVCGAPGVLCGDVVRSTLRAEACRTPSSGGGVCGALAFCACGGRKRALAGRACEVALHGGGDDCGGGCVSKAPYRRCMDRSPPHKAHCSRSFLLLPLVGLERARAMVPSS